MSKQDWINYKEKVLSAITDYSVVYSDLKKQKQSTGDWVQASCPFHNDSTPSFGYNRRKGNWVCFAPQCGKGDVFTYIMNLHGKNFKEALLELGSIAGIPKPFDDELKQQKKPPISESLVKRWVSNVNYNEEVRRYLREKRGLSEDTIKKYQIGWDEKRQRNTIPVRDEKGNIVNVRLYNAKKKPKMINYTEKQWKYGTPARLYGIDELIKYKDKQVILCEGENDRLLLQQEGFMAVTGTHGCGTFRSEWIPYFEDKDVVIIYDCDKEGQAAVQNIVLKAFKNSEVASIKNVVLPLRGEKEDKDITDFFHKRGLTAEDLQKIINDTAVYNYEKQEKEEEIVRLDSFIKIEQKEYVDKKIQCDITVCGETSEAFHAVEEFAVTYCLKREKGECFNCTESIKLPHNAQEYIGSCMSNNIQLLSMLRAFCCRYNQRAAIDILKRTTIKEFFCHQKVNRITHTTDEEGNVVQFIDGQKQELLEKRVYYISSDNVKPGNYLATGYVKTHPKTQQVTFLIESMIPEEDDYQSFDLEKNLVHLKAFQKLSTAEIIEDLTENVTKVYERDEILLGILLTYCSPLWIKFNGDRVRGWLVITIIGDSGSGKSQTYTRLAEFINLGDCFSGLTGTRTGLAYALVEHRQKGWQVKIGRYPANSRKILTVDETQHLPDWDLRAISKAMEEGFLQIDRVQSKGYESMTRLIMICNPKGDRVMDTFSFGCESLKSLFPPTIIRRTDLAIFTNSGDIKDISFINKKRDKEIPKRITPEMLRAVIYWVWNLKPDQVVFTPEAEQIALSNADEISDKFGDAVDVPLVLPSDFRNTLARVSASFAALSLSTNEEFSQLIVKADHIRMASEFLTNMYMHENCGLHEYSAVQRINNQLVDYERIEEAFLLKKENEIRHSDEYKGNFVRIIYFLRINDRIKREDLVEQVDCGDESVKNAIKLLKKFNLIDSTKKGYMKKPKFNKFLQRFFRNRPDFLDSEITCWGQV
nr:hypothetical protein 3 [Elusimicrobiota bacterium]